MCAVIASVLFKTFLRSAVEGECGDGAVEMWGSETPGAVGTAPAGPAAFRVSDKTPAIDKPHANNSAPGDREDWPIR